MSKNINPISKDAIKGLIKTNNISNKFLLNKNNIKNNISSIELISPRNNNFNIKINDNYINLNNCKKRVNKSNILSKNNNLKNIYTLNQTPIKDEKKYIKYIKDNYSADQKKIVNLPKLSNHFDKDSKKINISDVYKLPIILRNEYNTLIKPQKTEIKEETIKQHIKRNSSIEMSHNKELNEIKNKMNKDIKKNVNISIIDYNQICIKKNLKPIKILNKINKEDIPDFKKINNYSKDTKLRNYMKDKFYVDTEVRMNKKLKNIVFNHDQSLKDKIIEMNKIGDFWGSIVNYCNPVFTIKKFGYIKKKLNKDKLKKDNIKINKKFNDEINNIINLSGNKKNIKNDNKSMRLFTINSYFDYKHQKKVESKKEFLEKYNDSLQYYMV